MGERRGLLSEGKKRGEKTLGKRRITSWHKIGKKELSSLKEVQEVGGWKNIRGFSKQKG